MTTSPQQLGIPRVLFPSPVSNNNRHHHHQRTSIRRSSDSTNDDDNIRDDDNHNETRRRTKRQRRSSPSSSVLQQAKTASTSSRRHISKGQRQRSKPKADGGILLTITQSTQNQQRRQRNGGLDASGGVLAGITKMTSKRQMSSSITTTKNGSVSVLASLGGAPEQNMNQATCNEKENQVPPNFFRPQSSSAAQAPVGLMGFVDNQVHHHPHAIIQAPPQARKSHRQQQTRIKPRQKTSKQKPENKNTNSNKNNKQAWARSSSSSSSRSYEEPSSLLLSSEQCAFPFRNEKDDGDSKETMSSSQQQGTAFRRNLCFSPENTELVETIVRDIAEILTKSRCCNDATVVHDTLKERKQYWRKQSGLPKHNFSVLFWGEITDRLSERCNWLELTKKVVKGGSSNNNNLQHTTTTTTTTIQDQGRTGSVLECVPRGKDNNNIHQSTFITRTNNSVSALETIGKESFPSTSERASSAAHAELTNNDRATKPAWFVLEKNSSKSNKEITSKKVLPRDAEKGSPADDIKANNSFTNPFRDFKSRAVSDALLKNDSGDKSVESNKSTRSKNDRLQKHGNGNKSNNLSRGRQQSATQCTSSLVVATRETFNQTEKSQSAKGSIQVPGTKSSRSYNGTDMKAPANAVGQVMRQVVECARTSDETLKIVSARTNRQRSKPLRYSDEYIKAPKQSTPAKQMPLKRTRSGGSESGLECGRKRSNGDGDVACRSRRAPKRFCDEFLGNSAIKRSDGKNVGNGEGSKKGSGNHQRARRRSRRRQDSRKKSSCGSYKARNPPMPDHDVIDLISSDEDAPSGEEIIEIDDSSCDEEDSIERPTPPNPIDLIRASALHLSGIPTIRKRKVYYDQVELAIDNEVLLLDSEKTKAPTFKSTLDHNIYHVPSPRKTQKQPKETRSRVSDPDSSCCFDELEVASDTTYLRLLAHLPPIMIELDEQRRLPRHKNVPLDGCVQPPWRPPKKKYRYGLSTKLKKNPTLKRSSEAPRVEAVWSSQDVASLKNAYNQADALSTSFWDDIAECIEGKTGRECREKWLSLHKTPPRKADGKTKNAKVHPPAAGASEGDDDIFASTPLKGGMLDFGGQSGHQSSQNDRGHNGFPSFDVGSPITFQRKVADLPSLEDDEDNLETVDFRLKPGYVRYMRTQKTEVRKSQFRQQKSMKGRRKKAAGTISEHIGDGDVEVEGHLSPGGTLRVKNLSEEPEDEICFFEDVDEEEDEDAIF